MKVIKGSLEDLKRMQKKHHAEKAKAVKQAKEQAHKKKVSATVAAAMSVEDVALFQQVVRGVTPLPESNRIAHTVTPKAPKELLLAKRARAEGSALIAPNQQRPDKAETRSVAVHKMAEQDESSFVQNAHSKDLLKKLANGTWPVSATLDLHGTTAEQAAERFDRFMQSCIEHHVKCVCIIHGKGYGSKNGQAVLKDMVKAWLRQLEAVSAYIQAPENMGGAGAVMVLLNTRL